VTEPTLLENSVLDPFVRFDADDLIMNESIFGPLQNQNPTTSFGRRAIVIQDESGSAQGLA
jgi:hypothetical protein